MKIKIAFCESEGHGVSVRVMFGDEVLYLFYMQEHDEWIYVGEPNRTLTTIKCGNYADLCASLSSFMVELESFIKSEGPATELLRYGIVVLLVSGYATLMLEALNEMDNPSCKDEAAARLAMVLATPAEEVIYIAQHFADSDFDIFDYIEMEFIKQSVGGCHAKDSVD